MTQLLLSPPDPQARWVRDAQPLPGTSLTLVQWMYRSSDDAPEASASLYALVDETGKTVWQALLPSATADNESAETAQEDPDTTMHIDGPGAFSLHDQQTGTAIGYEATQTRATWQIIEGERRPWASVVPPEAPAPTAKPIPIITAIPLGQHRLADPDTASRDTLRGSVGAFAINAHGRFAVVLGGCDDADGERLVILDAAATGAVLGELALTRWFDCRHTLKVTAMADGRWLVAAASERREADRASVIVVAADGSNALPIEGFAPPPIDAIAGTENGFVALTSKWHTYSSEQALTAFHPDGSERWRVNDEHGNEHAIFNPEDVAITSDGDVVVLENVSDTLKIYDGNGRYRSSIDLAARWQREPQYPTELATDHRGGFVIRDFGERGMPSIVRMRSDGSIERELTPRMPDGHEFPLHGIHIDPEGALWTSDGYALLRLDDDGVVDHVIGNMPASDELGDIAKAVITSNGRFYAADARSGAVHAFDERGHILFVGKPLPEDRHDAWNMTLAVNERGDVWLQPDSQGDGPAKYVHFAPDGERIGNVQLGLDTVSETWVAARGSSHRWVLGYQQLYLVDSDDRVLAKQERASDGRWLFGLDSAATAADGTLAVLSESDVDIDNQPFVALFDAQAQPVGTLPVPEGFESWHPFAFDGKRVFFGWSDDSEAEPRAITATDLEGLALFRLMPTDERAIDTMTVVERDGREELWLFDGERTIERFAIP